MKILVIDDEKTNRDIIESHLSDEGHEVLHAENGVEGLEKINCNPDVSVILLDRMMPKMDGIEFLQILKQEQRFANIPVIMQTAASDNESVVQGIDAGVYYYLTKPYKRKILVSLVNAASNDVKKINELSDEVKKQQSTISFLTKGTFEITTLEQAHDLSFFLACAYPEPQQVILGISEMLINSIEHGNLGITYEQKSLLLQEGSLLSEIAKLQQLPENKAKKVLVKFKKEPSQISLTIKDEGTGFDWNPFFEVENSRLNAPNGRGIMMSKMVSFDEINYKENGSKVECILKLQN